MGKDEKILGWEKNGMNGICPEDIMEIKWTVLRSINRNVMGI